MNKKQRNRKIVAQNNRNRLINRRYTSTIKTLSKIFWKKIKEKDEKISVQKIVNNLYSIFDKAVKKGIVHKNTAARKKSKVGQIFTRHNITLLENDTSLKV
jgi:small subunit ribosomal protein S20